MKYNPFRTSFAENIFRFRYAQGSNDSWKALARRIVEDVCGKRWGCEPMQLLSNDEQKQLIEYITEMKFVPGGRYLYYAGRQKHFYNNCAVLVGAEDSREQWAELAHNATSWLMSGAGIGVEYSVFRPAGRVLHSSGGVACLTGDTVLYKDRKKSKKDNEITIEKLFELQKRPNRFNKVKIRSLDEATGVFYRNKVLGVFDNGIRDVFDIKTKNGYRIKATANHRFMGENQQYYYVSNFNIGDKIAVNGKAYSVNCKRCGRIIRYGSYCSECYDKRGIKSCIECGAPITRKSKRCHSCQSLNQQVSSANDKTARQRKACRDYYESHDACEVCGEKEGRFEVHHIDRNPYNNDPSNLLYLCVKCHQRFAAIARTHGNPYSQKYVDFDGIVSIDFVGKERVYDIQMESPNYNFVANGFVSHNSGPIPLMHMINEIARNVIQGGSRRSACWAGLVWSHEDIEDFLKIKEWSEDVVALKAKDFNFPAPLDMTNVSVGWDNEFLECVEVDDIPDLWYDSCYRMMKTGEPGHSYNFYEYEHEVGRNACTEITSEYDSDVCNLGSLNLSRIESKEELQDVAYLASKFLVCGTLRADLPYQKCYDVRNDTRRIGLGLMGVHEWLLGRGYDYSMNEELENWLQSYVEYSEKGANEHCDRFYLQRPIKYRAAAPNGTTGIICSTTTGIEPIFALAYKRRYLLNGSRWQYEYVIDATAEYIKNTYGLDSNQIETAYSLAVSPEKRIKFQYDIQKYIDQGISSTINLPAWGTEHNNEDKVEEFSNILLKYCHGLRGITCYPDGSRGGQPLIEVPYDEAKQGEGIIFDEDENKCSGSICGM